MIILKQFKILSSSIQLTTKALLVLLSFLPLLAQAIAPKIQAIPDQTVELGSRLSFTPTLNGQTNNQVNWSIAYGPDAVQINQGTGEISWQVPGNLPSESFYIGVKASNSDGEDIEYFIAHAGVPLVVQVGPSHEIKDLAQALRAYQAPGNQFQVPGATFVVENGTYNTEQFRVGLLNGGQVQMPPGGNASAMTTVMAQRPGQVELGENASIVLQGGTGNPSYIALKGFYMNGGAFGVNGSRCDGNTSCYPHHIKIEAIGANLQEDQGFGASYARDILLENNYVFGGGRAKIILFHTQRVVARRNVARFDWVNTGEFGPQNTFSFYTTVDAAVQNNIAVDSDSKLFWPLAEDAGEFGCPVTQGPSRMTVDGNIQLNSEKAWGNMDSQNANICVADLNNNVAWDIRPIGTHVIARGAVDINRMTIGSIKPEITDGWLIDGVPGDTRGFRNSIIHDVSSSDIFRNFEISSTAPILGQVYPRTGVSNINITATSARLNERYTSDTVIDRSTLTGLDPLSSTTNANGALKYIVRTEPGNNMAHLGSDRKGLGATVMNMQGRTGSFWGETGYDEETNRPVWPFPLQDVIQEKMASMSYTGAFYAGGGLDRRRIGTATLSGNRGFATSGRDLTHYIWGYLGNAVPPMNVSAQSDGNDTIVRWDRPTNAYRGAITGYRVYDFDPRTSALSNPRNASAGATNLTIENSGGNTSYVVTAVHQSRGEGGYAYPSAGSQVDSLDPPTEIEQPVPVSRPIAPVLRVLDVTNTEIN